MTTKNIAINESDEFDENEKLKSENRQLREENQKKNLLLKNLMSKIKILIIFFICVLLELSKLFLPYNMIYKSIGNIKY